MVSSVSCGEYDVTAEAKSICAEKFSVRVL